MAKKKSGRRGTFNMSAAVREVVQENPKLKAKEVEAEIKRRHPGAEVNSNSLAVAFSSARKKLGIVKGKKKTVRKRLPAARRAATSSAVVDMNALQAAQKYVSAVGDVEVALEAVRQLKALQVG